jgi:hypothetical protein
MRFVSCVSSYLALFHKAKGLCQLCQCTPRAFSNRPVAGGVSWDARYVEEIRGGPTATTDTTLGKV